MKYPWQQNISNISNPATSIRGHKSWRNLDKSESKVGHWYNWGQERSSKYSWASKQFCVKLVHTIEIWASRLLHAIYDLYSLHFWTRQTTHQSSPIAHTVVLWVRQIMCVCEGDKQHRSPRKPVYYHEVISVLWRQTVLLFDKSGEDRF